MGVEVHLKSDIVSIEHGSNFLLTTKKEEKYEAKSLLLATGSSKVGHKLAQDLGHTIDPLLPSLFTFNTPSSPLLHLSGIALLDVELRVEKMKQRGPALLTHLDLVGPQLLNFQLGSRLNYLPKIINRLSPLIGFQISVKTKFLLSYWILKTVLKIGKSLI